jgi:multidrug transporter EmrE-like cation transporter
MLTLAAALGCVLLSVSAQFVIKAGLVSAAAQGVSLSPLGLKAAIALVLNPGVAAGLALYTLGALVWLGVLSRWDVSKAYPLEGLGFVLVVVIGFLIGEPVTLKRTLGVLLICVGVFFVGSS